MHVPDWNGSRVTRARAVVQTWLPAPCGQCGQEVTAADEFVVGHIRSRLAYPELTWVVSNWQPEHASCSVRTGRDVRLEAAHLAGARAALGRAQADGAAAVLADLDAGLFPLSVVGPATSVAPVPPPGGWVRTAQTGPIEPREDLSNPMRHCSAVPWLEDLVDVPDDAAPPLWMSPPHPDAVGSYGADAIRWVEQVERKRLRWWQRLAITRQLEHDATGALVWRTILESAPRRAGKSVRMRGVALWRMEKGPALFGEMQTVVHTGSDVAICREIQRGAWRWAEDVAGWEVSRANGKEAVESLGGDRWLVRAQTAVYGYDVTLGLGDECWNVEPGTISEGLEPAMLERSSPQLHLTSTAHRRATSLMRGRLSTALSVDDGRTLVMVWAAPLGADPADPDVWRAASPHWSEDRRQMLESKYLAAEAGQVDPEADDPDPMAGFTAQYLNLWRLTARREAPGTPLITEDEWADLLAVRDDRRPDAAAIDTWVGQGASLALAWREGTAAVVSVTGHADLAGAVRLLRQSGYRGAVTVPGAIEDDPALARVRRVTTAGRAAQAAADLARLIKAGALQHDGSPHLTEQVLDIRTAPGTDGVRLVSKARADGVKAAAWAATDARARARAAGGLGIVLPTSSDTPRESA